MKWCGKCYEIMEEVDIDDKQKWVYITYYCKSCGKTITIKEDKEI